MKTSLTVVAVCVVALLSVSFLVPAAHAGFVTINASPMSDVSGHGPPDFAWDLMPDDSGNAKAVLTELFGDEMGGEYGVLVSGVTDSDPILDITKDVKNTSSSAWIGYSIILDPLDTDTFVGIPTSGGTSGGMTLVNQTAYELDWGTPNAVQPGQTVTFSFQVNVPDTGDFNFSLTQLPTLEEQNIPEPATISLVSLAALLLAAVVRKRA